ncbi:MAG: phage integrase SAM-like domain-containing protein [Cyclobacteriaceae bacterium]
MKLSKLTYHNGAIKIEVYQKGQDRKRWNTGIRINKKLLSKDKFIKPNAVVDWETLNIKLSEEKERVDGIVRQLYKENKYVDVLKVFEILNQQKVAKVALLADDRDKAHLKNGTVKRKLVGAIHNLKTSIKENGVRGTYIEKTGTGETQHARNILNREGILRQKFLNELNTYLQKESAVTTLPTTGKFFVEYLTEGTAIGYTNLKRHFRLFEFMINNPILIEDTNDAWIRRLIDWLGCGAKNKPVNSNTTDWLFGRFQCFWTWALNNNIVHKRIHWKRFKRMTFKPGFVWITEERINQLAKTKLKDQRLEYTRMAYLIMTLTALRHSDFHSLSPKDVIYEDGKYYIHKSNKKTKTVFKTEIHTVILDWVRNEDMLKKIKFSMDSWRFRVM